MKNLPNIKLTEQDLNLLIEDNLFDFGGEAIICKNNNPHSVYKILVYPGSDVPQPMSDNKLKKVLYYYQNDILGIVKPLSTLEYNNQLIGYEITYDRNNISLLDSPFIRENTLEYLRQSKELLDYFSTKDITYGDVTSDNILVNRRTNKVSFCDIDNTRVGEYPIDVMSYALDEYFEETGKVDATADAYMHNILTLEQLHYRNKTYYEILQKLRKENITGDIPIELKEIIESMKYPKNFTGEYIIPHIKQKTKK